MKKTIVIIGLLASQSVFSNPLSNKYWHDVSDNYLSQLKIQSKNKSAQLPVKRRSLTLNEQGLKSLLTSITSVSSTASIAAKTLKSDLSQTSSQSIEISLPLPDGGFILLKAFDSPILSVEIAEQYPEIKTWRVQGIENPRVTGRLDFTSKGFHGMLNMPDGDTVFIDPDENNVAELYHSLSKHENISRFNTDFNCQAHNEHPLKDLKKSLASNKASEKPASDLITYRLAIAGTGEYTNSQGGSATSAYSSMVTTINRVNEIYQRDLGVKLEIVTGNNFAYTNSSTDPYTNNNASSLIAENISNINSSFGASNYDVGHVFAQGPLGGLAYVGATCQDNYKAGGTTGITDPQGETFSIEYVAHEMGHQLGATHSFNSTEGGCGGGNRTQTTAAEPGSGSTIMSYSGLCGSDNIENTSDAMFHILSIVQISNYTRQQSGKNCGSRNATGNQNPEANAGADSTIPLNTPFFLKGAATGGASYSWEQYDTGSSSAVDVDTSDNAIIRTFLPSASKDRYIPRLSNLFSGTRVKGEILPQTVRELNFSLVVRDNNGGLDADLKLINVRDTGGTFKLLSHSSTTTLTTGDTTDVAWSVAGTNNAPISCSKVDIQLLRVDGTRNMLLANTDNDGSQQFIVPNNTPTMSGARMMIACSSEDFFQISSGSIAVTQGSGNQDTTAPVITINGDVNVSIVKGTSYTDAGATAEDGVDGNVSVSSSGSVDVNTVGSYQITYTATDSSNNTSTAIRVIEVTAVADTTPPVITLIGSNNIEIEKGTTYSDAGATATDNVDSIVSVSSTGTVNTSVVGVYTITYTATDAANNSSEETRTVNVVDNTTADTVAPVITVSGSQTISIVQGTSYTDAGAVARDNRDGTVSVTSSGSVDTSKVGVYTITYTASDAAGNTTTTIRTVYVTAIVVDNIAPVIVLNGAAYIELSVGSTYVEAGATATDNIDSIVPVMISSAINTNVAGTYTVTYQAIDSAKNKAIKTRTVKVIQRVSTDTKAPKVTLLGSVSITLTEGDSYTEPGFSAVDDRDGSVSVKVSGTVDTNKSGSYQITYSATDAAGNTSTVFRTVTVREKNNGGHSEGKSSGGSMSFLLLPLLLTGFRRFFVAKKP